MTLKGPRWSKLPETMSHHLLGDVHGDMSSPVVHRDGVADHFRNDNTGPCPRFDNSLLSPFIQLFDFLPEFWVYVRTFL